jgi:hypothetical protein
MLMELQHILKVITHDVWVDLLRGNLYVVHVQQIIILSLRHLYAGISEHSQEILDVMRGVASKG